MALIVQTNMPAIKSQRHLGFTQNSLSKSIERLSSGLRINSPGDDASGLSIAETLKNQRMGFDRAYLNAQDGLSMLQVADGTLSQINSMLSRIRELAIQSANGVYNANDRTIIQREVDQLKDEINRLSYSAEFNTKKLLNGDSAGYWSSNSPNFDVVMNGNIKSGNYRFVTDTTYGQNAVYETDIFTHRNSQTTVNVTSGNELIKQIHPLDVPANNPITGEKLNYNFQVRNDYVNKNDQDTVIVGSSNTENSLNKIDNRLRDVEVNRSGYLLVEFNKGYPDNLEEGQVVDGYVTLTWYDANGEGTEKVNVAAEFDSAGNFLGLISNDYLHDLFPSVTGLIFPSDDFNVDLTALSAFDEGVLDLDDIDDVQAGDKVLLGISDRNSAAEQADALEDQGIESENMYVRLNSFSNDSDEVYVDVQFNQLSNTNQIFQQVEMDENGNVWTYKYSVDFADNVKAKVDEMSRIEEGPIIPIFNVSTGINNMLGYHDKVDVTFDVTENVAGQVINYDTMLKDIAQFAYEDGPETFATSRDLTVYSGKGQSKTIHLAATDTLRDLDNKLTQALNELGLTSQDPTVNEKLVTFVTPDNMSMYGGNVVAEGSMVIQSATPGKEGELYFTGDEALMRGLSLTQLRNSSENVSNTKVYDLYTNQLVASETSKDGTFVKAIPNATIIYSSNKLLDAKWANGGVEFGSSSETADIHLASNQAFVHVGANANQEIEFSLPRVDTTALGIDDLFVVDGKSANRAITLVDRAQTRINDIRGTIGAQMNRMENALNQVQVASENMSASESRIRDLDMAKEMTQFTKNQILSQTANAMLAQANMMPQLVLQLLGA